MKRDRPWVNGNPLPIPWTTIDRFAERYGVKAFERFTRLVTALDNAWLEHWSEMNPPPKARK